MPRERGKCLPRIPGAIIEMPNYAHGKIYRIDVGDEYYIGSTCLTLPQRFSNHRQDRNRTSVFYQKVRAVGIENCRMTLVEEYPCNSREELSKREEYWVGPARKDPLCLNRKAAYNPRKTLSSVPRIMSVVEEPTHTAIGITH